jgi:hypothetical protein
MDAKEPPWSKYPELQRGSIGWRMGHGEDYMDEWNSWFETLTDKMRKEYFDENKPIPEEWIDFVDSRITKQRNNIGS